MSWSPFTWSDELIAPQWRLMALPQIAEQPCAFCNKRLLPSDGLSTETGWLPSSHKAGVPADKAEKPDGDAADVKMDQEEGKWVHWHASCRP